ncbi:MAG: DUF3375 domain-containing protein [Chitinophagaceae bacterium]|nr:DUF3375 domain-containing protein [Chitinophagaceae bacterium]
MDFAKAYSLYKNDKTLQILRAEHFPLLISFFHLAFKQQDRIFYQQQDLRNILSDFLYSLEQQGIDDFRNDPLDYLQQWAKQGYLRRYYDVGDEPVYELTPATENALKWLDDLTKQQFVGTHSRLLQLFSILKQLVNNTASPYDRVKKLEEDRIKLDKEIEDAKRGIYEKTDDTRIREDYLLAEETAKRLLADFRQVEQNFRELDKDTRQAIIKSSLTKGKLLDDIFSKQDFLWSTDQGKSFKAFWEFLMSRNMQEELELLITKINELPAIKQLKSDVTIDRLKTNLVEAGDKVNRTNDGLLEQLRKFVEQKSLLESKRILNGLEWIETHLLELKDSIDTNFPLLTIDGLFKPSFIMERPLFKPPVKVIFQDIEITEGESNAETDALYEQFFIDIELLKENIRLLLKNKSQVSLNEVFRHYKPVKGIAEVLGYMQIASRENKHLIDFERSQELIIENIETEKQFTVQVPVVVFNR